MVLSIIVVCVCACVCMCVRACVCESGGGGGGGRNPFLTIEFVMLLLKKFFVPFNVYRLYISSIANTTRKTKAMYAYTDT